VTRVRAADDEGDVDAHVQGGKSAAREEVAPFCCFWKASFFWQPRWGLATRHPLYGRLVMRRRWPSPHPVIPPKLVRADAFRARADAFDTQVKSGNRREPLHAARAPVMVDIASRALHEYLTTTLYNVCVQRVTHPLQEASREARQLAHPLQEASREARQLAHPLQEASREARQLAHPLQEASREARQLEEEPSLEARQLEEEASPEAPQPKEEASREAQQPEARQLEDEASREAPQPKEEASREAQRPEARQLEEEASPEARRLEEEPSLEAPQPKEEASLEALQPKEEASQEAPQPKEEASPEARRLEAEVASREGWQQAWQLEARGASPEPGGMKGGWEACWEAWQEEAKAWQL
jgi:hypothetical protein